MARRDRGDGAGVIHHVINRGIAKRTCFERRADIRKFLAELAHAVRRGEIEVLAYCILTTHFHLVLRSLRGELSETMRRVQNAHVRAFNRRRRRDGPLFRGRFWSRPVGTEAYLRVLVRYVDHNSVSARLAGTSQAYPWGSAGHYASGVAPPWLERATVEGLVASGYVDGVSTPARYVQTFGRPPTLDEVALVESRVAHDGIAVDPTDDLLSAAAEDVLAWMTRKAQLADGTRPGLPLAGPASVCAAIRIERAADAVWTVRPQRVRISGWDVMEAGLLRWHSGCTFSEVATRVGVSTRAASGRAWMHVRLLIADADYARRAARVLQSSLSAAYGVR